MSNKFNARGGKGTAFKSPFPYFGGKSTVADIVWDRFGTVDNYCEPFFGSGAILLGRPGWTGVEQWTETVNDADGFICNFWRALQSDPDAVAHHADWPVNESDLEARHLWLVNRRKELTDKLNDPDFYDAKAAGWWVWGISCWIASGWCSGSGPWRFVDGKIVDSRQRTDLVGGKGVNRGLPNLGDAGRGVNRQLPHLGDAGRGLRDYLGALAARLRRVRVCCGDWSRICGPTPTTKLGMTAVFLDPPYTDKAERASDLYAVDCERVGHDVAEWCRKNQDNKLLRIALCGYEGEYELPGWECFAWKAHGGYENLSTDEKGPSGNCKKERIWFSPNCLSDSQGRLF
jgi:site-specific DNA-adenine methylase